MNINNKILEDLEILYKEYGFLNKLQFANMAYDKLHKIYTELPVRSIAKEFVEKKPDYQVAVKAPPKVIYQVARIPGTFQMDIIFFNNDKLPFLLIIEVCSRKIWLYYLGHRTNDMVYKAFKYWYYYGNEESEDNERHVKGILSDQEKAFIYNKQLQDFFQQHDIKYIAKDRDEHNIMKLLDRAVRTIKDMMYRKNLQLTAEEFQNITRTDFPKYAESVVNDYNKKPHAGIYNLTPNQVSDNLIIQNAMYKDSLDYNQELREKDKKFLKNKYVRILQRKENVVDKSKYYTDKVFKINSIRPYSYGVESDDPLIQNSRFKPYELKEVPADAILTEGKKRFNSLKNLRRYKEYVTDYNLPSKKPKL